MKKNNVVMPGDQLSTSEELLPGDGTFEENGIIRASRMGTYHVDEKYKRAKVQPLTSIPVILRKGDIVLARIAVTKPSMIITDIIHVIGKERSISGETNSTIHASEISQSYIKDASTEYKVGDIVRAQIIQVQPSIQLTTKGRELGAIKALCTKCRRPLVKHDNALECQNCGNKERRTIAPDYGNVDIKAL
ncbi:MAG: exosome complex RNA-binding protein Csl4 [Euryarchaeota archaeon]|nr:exosome complex RNA-binding protein Csl4 [Euryarchaeota archaeon]